MLTMVSKMGLINLMPRLDCERSGDSNQCEVVSNCECTEVKHDVVVRA